jgi:hypothetical protein
MVGSGSGGSGSGSGSGSDNSGSGWVAVDGWQWTGDSVSAGVCGSQNVSAGVLTCAYHPITVHTDYCHPTATTATATQPQKKQNYQRITNQNDRNNALNPYLPLPLCHCHPLRHTATATATKNGLSTYHLSK